MGRAVKFDFWKLYAVQRIAEWIGISVLTFSFLVLNNSTDMYAAENQSLLWMVLSAFMIWGNIVILSGWFLISMLSYLLYRLFKHPRRYAFSSMLFSAFWSGLWLAILLLTGLIQFDWGLVEITSLWLLGLTANYFVALWTHRWLIRWPDPVAA